VTSTSRRGWWAVRPTTPDGGSATAELAVSLPALVLLMLAGLTGVAAVRTQLECVDAARDAARAVARGAPPPGPPAGASLAVVGNGDQVRATVRVHRHPLGANLPGFDITATATAAMEPGPEPS
jgi:hypothetical protein